MARHVTASGKLCVLALDAANPTLLMKWAGEGMLPNLAGLMAHGLVGETRSVEGLFVGATWPSFYTGRHPGSHGLYWLDRLRPGSYRLLRARPRDFGRLPALWDVLSLEGKDVIVLDVPLARRSPRLRGAQVVEWGVHDAAFGFQTSPRSLRREILGTVGAHPAPSRCDAPSRSLREYRLFADQLIRGASARGKLTRHLLGTREWDFAIQVFSETHCAGHQLWHFHDESHPGFDANARAEVGDLLRDVYVAVDTAVGDVVASLDQEVTIVLLVLHGMSHVGGASLVLPEVLTRLGVMGLGEQTLGKDGSAGAGGSAGLLARTYRLLPRGVRAPIYEWRQRLNQRWLGRGTPLGIDPSTTKAFHIGMGTGSPFSGIRLNIRGRDPMGTIHAGTEQELFCHTLMHDLLEVVDPITGRPLVSRVLRTADIYPGSSLDELPDLLVEWDMSLPRGSGVIGPGEGAVWRATSPKVGEVSVTNRYCRTGEHRIEGMFVARGPGIANGHVNRTLSILDFAPTFAQFFRAEMPDADGRVIPELLA